MQSGLSLEIFNHKICKVRRGYVIFGERSIGHYIVLRAMQDFYAMHHCF